MACVVHEGMLEYVGASLVAAEQPTISSAEANHRATVQRGARPTAAPHAIRRT
jgi:hypothetical protein